MSRLTTPAKYYDDIERALSEKRFISATLALYKAEGSAFDKIIRAWTGGEYSHVEIALSNIEFGVSPWCLSSSPRDGGVRAKQIALTKTNWDLVDLPWASPASIHERFKLIDGAPYDRAGILLTQIIKTNLINTHYFCSEASAYMLHVPRPTHFSPDHLGALMSTFAPIATTLLKHRSDPEESIHSTLKGTRL